MTVVRSKPSESLYEYLILMYGPEKIGKTTFWRHAPAPVFFMFEPGFRAIEIDMVPISSWAQFKTEAKRFADSPYRTAVIDTAEAAYLFAMAYICEEMGIDHPADEEFGKGWGRLSAVFRETMYSLSTPGKGIVFLSHEKPESFKKRRGGESSKIVPNVSKGVRDFLDAVIDIWIHYAYDGESRVIELAGSDEVSAGHRLENRFLWPDGSPIKTINAGPSSKSAYLRLTKAFENRLEKEKGT